MSDTKKYNNYKNMDISEEEWLEYSQVDSYVKPGSENKNVGKMDNYSKEQQKYNTQKAKVKFQSSEPKANNIDNLVPDTVGNAIDNVFAKVDSVLDATGKFFWGAKKPKAPVKKKSAPPPQPRPQPQARVQQPADQPQ